MVDTSFEGLGNVVLKKQHAGPTCPHLLYVFKAFEAERRFAGGQTASESHENHHPASNASKKHSI